MDRDDLLDTQVISCGNGILLVRRWWRGVHPDRGTITPGWSGWETVEERNQVVLRHTFRVDVDGSNGG